MLKAVTQSEETHIREQEQARTRDKQLRSVRQTKRSGFNYFTLTNSTSIRNDNAITDPPGVHFNKKPNPPHLFNYIRQQRPLPATHK